MATSKKSNARSKETEQVPVETPEGQETAASGPQGDETYRDDIMNDTVNNDPQEAPQEPLAEANDTGWYSDVEYHDGDEASTTYTEETLPGEERRLSDLDRWIAEHPGATVIPPSLLPGDYRDGTKVTPGLPPEVRTVSVDVPIGADHYVLDNPDHTPAVPVDPDELAAARQRDEDERQRSEEEHQHQ